MKKKEAFVNLIYVIFFLSLGYFATDIYLPSLPEITTYFNTSRTLVQFTLFAYLLSFSVAPIVSGPLSDHFGRKKTILFGMILSVLSSIGCATSISIYYLIILRFIQGLGTGTVVVCGRSILTDSFQGKELAKKMGIMTLTIPIILAIAPFIGGFLQEHLGWRSTFYFLVFYFFLVLCATYLFKETLIKPKEITPLAIFKNYRPLFSNTSYLLYALSYTLPYMGMFAYYAAGPFLFQDLLGLSPVEYGSLAIYTSSVIIISAIINLRLLAFIRINYLIYAGNFTIFLSGFLLLLFSYLGLTGFWYMFIPCLIFFISAPLTTSNGAAKTLMQVKRNFGSANALISTFQILGGTLATLLFSFLEESNFIPLAIFFLALSILTTLCAFFAKRYEVTESEQLK